MTKREKWIAEFKTSMSGAEAIEELKELEDHRGRDGIEELRDKILEACFMASYYEHSRDFYEIGRTMDRKFRNIESLLECIKKHPHFARVKAEHFLTLLGEKGILIHVDDTMVEMDLVRILETVIESICESTSLHVGNPRSVLGNIDYSKDLIDRNQKPEAGKIGLIYQKR